MADNKVLAGVCADLAAEHAALDELVAGLASEAWDRPTPAEGWAIRDQISHLAWFDERAVEAALTPEVFQAGAAAMLDGLPDSMEVPVLRGRAMTVADLLVWWRQGRVALLDALGRVDPNVRIPWYGPPMGAVSFVTARLMETWAHGQDVADALGVARPITARLRHVAHIGVGAMAFSFRSHGLDPPAGSVRVELEAPDGDRWTWGDAEAADLVRGEALDFCLVVTQRRHLADTRLEVAGPEATRWMGLAQAFAGPPGPGRRPGQFPR